MLRSTSVGLELLSRDQPEIWVHKGGAGPQVHGSQPGTAVGLDLESADRGKPEAWVHGSSVFLKSKF